MKRTILILVGAMMVLGASVQALAETPASRAQTLYRQGLLAMEHGQVDTARRCFQEVLRLQPNNINAKYQLKNLQLRQPRLHAKRREMELSKVIVPSVDYEDLALPEALEALSAVIEKESKGTFIPNFVVQDPNKVFAERTFSLKLGRVPASYVLKSMLESAKATVRYDEHAIVIRPIGGARSSPKKEGATESLQDRGAARDPFAK